MSGDFWNHPVANYIEPVLIHLHRDPGLELHAYYNNEVEDGVTGRLRGCFSIWRPVLRLSDVELGRQISDDHIDILIDLSGHTTLNRLRVFAARPAPVQASWIGYPGTTGFKNMDYYLTDQHFTPAGKFDHLFTERLAYLPGVAPFRPFERAPAVNPLPALQSGVVTFGSFNRLGKINDRSIRLWSELLEAVPQSRLLLANLPAGELQAKMAALFAAYRVGPERLSFMPRMGMEQYLALHHEVDLCLDTFPYNGSTTSMHAAWMGVPTLTIAGSTVPGNAGAWLLAQLGTAGFTGEDARDFVAKGRYWCAHLAELAQVRAALRTRLQQSPALDATAIPAAFARALRHMWKLWCAGEAPQSFTA